MQQTQEIVSTLTQKQLTDLTTVPGAISVQEVMLLHWLATQVPDGCIVELGSFRGRSTAALALGSASANRVPVYAIEPHEVFTGVHGGKFGPQDRGGFFETMLKLGVFETVRLVNLSSEFLANRWPHPVRLLWVDGDHSDAGVERDLNCWLPKLHPQAVIAFHDAADPAGAPARAIQVLLAAGGWQTGPAVDLIRTIYRPGS